MICGKGRGLDGCLGSIRLDEDGDEDEEVRFKKGSAYC